MAADVAADMAVDMEARLFLARHRPRLIEIAKSASPALQGDADLTKLLEEIYRDFDSVSDKPGKRESLPGEDVFWWCVTILEELEEVARPGPKTDPYLSMMIEQLKDMGGRLERNEALPARFGIHWFDELDDIWEDENLSEDFR